MSGATWPYDSSELLDVYASSTYDDGLWSLNSAPDTYQAMTANGVNLFLSDVNGTDIWFKGDDSYIDKDVKECDWYSWAALNDHIEAAFPGGDNTAWTGIVVGPDHYVAEHWPCTFLPWVNRARLEAADHSNIVKVVLIDELWRLMDGPDSFTYQDCDNATPPHCNAHWGTADVNSFANQVRQGQYAGPDGGSPCTAPATTPTNPLPGLNLELWSRMIDVGVPRYIVPSSVLGVPGWPGSGSASDHELLAREGAQVSWIQYAADHAVVSFPASWEARIDFLYVTGSSQMDDIELELAINGTPVGAATAYLGGLYSDEVHVDSACIGGPSCFTSSAWNSASLAPNTVQIALVAQANTDSDIDRTAYVWAVGISYVNTNTGQVFWRTSYFNPRAPNASYGLIGTPGAATIADDNDQWRISGDLDGVQIARVDAHAYDADAYERLMHHACKYLHESAEPKRCLAGVRGAAFSTSWYESDVDTAEMVDRLDLGDTYGDGTVSAYLPLTFDYVDTESGRYDTKDPIDGSSDLMLYEPRLTHTNVGEHHEYVGTVPAGCSGEYTVAWEVTPEADEPKLHWWADLYDASAGGTTPIDDGYVDPSATNLVDSVPVNADPSDEFHIYWVNEGGGASITFANNAQFVITPPSSGCALTWDHTTGLDTTIDTSTGTVTLTTPPEDVYDCLVDYFTTGTCP